MSTDKPIERFFYHSFPRRYKGNEEDREKPLAILESICKNGLLLVPEVVIWTDVSLNKIGGKIIAEQLRACFTELPRRELEMHSKVFGPYSIEFDIVVISQNNPA